MINNQETPRALPKVRSINGGGEYLEIDPEIFSETMSTLGVSDETIERTTVILDGKSRIGIKGVAFPDSKQWLARKKYPELADDINGPAVRLSTVMRRKRRTIEEINATSVHEIEHLSQFDRKDKKVGLGRAAIYGGMLAGAVSGNLVARNKHPVLRAAATLAGAAIGKEAGYRLAPHENQARARSRTVTSRAIRTK
jgi:hypothetical protein